LRTLHVAISHDFIVTLKQHTMSKQGRLISSQISATSMFI